MLDDYEMIVFNDADDPEHEKAFVDLCAANDIPCVRFEQVWHAIDPLNQYIKECVENPDNHSWFIFDLEEGKLTPQSISKQASIRHNHVIQYALDHFGYDHDDIVVLLDHDLFPIKPFSVRALLTDVPIIGIDSNFCTNAHYLWVPFIAFDPKRLPDIQQLKFHCDVIDHLFCDSGSASHHYLQAHPDIPYRMYRRCYDREFYHLPIPELKAFGFSREEVQLIKSMPWPGCIEFYVDYQFIHYGTGSADFHPIKRAGVFAFLNKILRK